MSIRNRPRNGTVKDEDEEITMFNQIRKDLEKLGTMQKRQIELAELIKQKEVDIKELQINKSMLPPKVMDNLLLTNMQLSQSKSTMNSLPCIGKCSSFLLRRIEC